VSPNPEPSGRDLIGEWQKLMESILTSAASSVGGRAELPRRLVEPMQRQLELVQELIERERNVQRQVTSRLIAPFDVIFDLLEQNGAMLRSQAEALEAAGEALENAARLVKTQAELFERAIGVLRQPTELAKTATGLERHGRKTSQKPKRPERKPSARKSSGGDSA
jgi:hypothetical protein